MRLTYRTTLLLLILGLLFLGACGQDVATAPAPATATTETETESVSPLPTPTTQPASEPVVESTPAATPNLTPSPGLGIVRGTLTIGGALAQNETLYLAPIVLTGESMSIAGLDTNTAPRTETDATGAFAFLDVPPGDYALAAVGPVGPVIVPGPDGDEVTTTVQAGETSDLGDIAAPPFH